MPNTIENHRARGYNDAWIYEIASYLQKPDYAFFLDVDVDTALSRVRGREEEKDKYIDIPLQYRLREQYLRIAEECGGTVVRSDGKVQTCFAEIVKRLHIFKSEAELTTVG